jgi:type II secretory pathway component PulF
MLGPFAAAVVRAGEESGTLDNTLAQLAEHHERSAELLGELRSALWYPMLMGTVAGIGVLVLLGFVVPRFVAMLGEVGGDLPFTTRTLVLARDWIIGGWWIWLPLTALLILAARSWLERPVNRRRWHAFRLRIPLSGELERMVSTARFARAFGVLVRGGTGALEAIRIAGDTVTNAALKQNLADAALAVGRGEGIAASLSDALPPLAVQLLSAGEESGRLDEMCLRVAEGYETESGRTIRTLVRLVEPALILVFGVLVGFIALAMLQAVYSINAGIG